MGKDKKDPEAHCNGYLVLKREQDADEVKTALDLLPEELHIEYRFAWDQQRHDHLLQENSVVLMVRSSADTLEEEARGAGDVGHGSIADQHTASLSGIASQKALLGILRSLRDKQRIGLVRYTKPSVTSQRLIALCIPPSAHAFEKLGVPWRFRDMAGHDTLLVVAGYAKSSNT
jgi:hypothetical protein